MLNLEDAIVAEALLDLGKAHKFKVLGESNLVGRISFNRSEPLNVALKGILRGQSYSMREEPIVGCPGQTRVTQIRVFPPGTAGPERGGQHPVDAGATTLSDSERASRAAESDEETRTRLGKRKRKSWAEMSEEDKTEMVRKSGVGKHSGGARKKSKATLKEKYAAREQEAQE